MGLYWTVKPFERVEKKLFNLEEFCQLVQSLQTCYII